MKMAYVEQGAVEAVLRAARLLEKAGDEQGALRELEHFAETLCMHVMIPLDKLIERDSESSNDISWVVRSNPELFRLIR